MTIHTYTANNVGYVVDWAQHILDFLPSPHLHWRQPGQRVVQSLNDGYPPPPSSATKLFLASHRVLSPETVPGHEQNIFIVVTPRMTPQKTVVIHRATVAYITVSSASLAHFRCTIIFESSHALHKITYLKQIIRQMFKKARVTSQAHQP